jgi:hypothetical protein
MATVYRAPLVTIILVNSGGQGTTMGMARNFTLQKAFQAELIPEIGNFFAAENVLLGVQATFSWATAWVKAQDWVKQGIIPADSGIAQFEPFACRVVDQEADTLICTIYKALIQSYDINVAANQVVLSNCTGLAITANYMSELQ